MSLNRSETAQKLNVSLTTLDNWRRKGCPHTKTGKQVFFDIAALNCWLDDRSNGELDYTQERAKLTSLKAEKVTLYLEQQRGKLLPLDMVIEAWQGQVANARAKLLVLPPKLASQVLGMESYVQVEQAIRNIIYETLEELAGTSVSKEYKKKGKGSHTRFFKDGFKPITVPKANILDKEVTENILKAMGGYKLSQLQNVLSGKLR